MSLGAIECGLSNPQTASSRLNHLSLLLWDCCQTLSTCLNGRSSRKITLGRLESPDINVLKRVYVKSVFNLCLKPKLSNKPTIFALIRKLYDCHTSGEIVQRILDPEYDQESVIITFHMLFCI